MRYFLGLGANLGDRLTNLREATRRLEDLGAVLARSRVYATTPVGGPAQPQYLNAAVLLDSPLSPTALLAGTQAIEEALGRDRAREVRWGPRTLDLNLLLAGARGELVVDDPGLRLPHPRLQERGFALAPLLNLDATLIHPVLGRPLEALLAAAQADGQAWAPSGDAL